MKQTIRYTRAGKPPPHRYHVRLHFTPEDEASVDTAVVSSTNDLDEAMADLHQVRRLHPNADIFDSVVVRTYTPCTSWQPVHPKKEPPE